MNFDEVKRYVQKAFENDEVEKLLLGEDDYWLPYPYQFNLPLDAHNYDKVLKEINVFLKNNSSAENYRKFETALLNLSVGKPFYTWVAFTSYYIWKIFENKNKSSFILKKEIQESIKKGIIKNEEPLRTHHLFDEEDNETYLDNINRYCHKYFDLYHQNLLGDDL